MRILILGGTSFIGRAATRMLLQEGHEIALCHRGLTEPPEFAEAVHIHVDRADLGAQRPAIAAFAPDAVLDTFALTRSDAENAIGALPAGVPAVVLSSQDVYEAFDGFLSGRVVSAVPLAEDAPLRKRRHLYQEDSPPGVPAEYEKIDVEAVWSEAGAMILRLPMVYGPYDPQCREGFVLRRIVAGRTQIPIGAGNLLWSRAHVDDVAAATATALKEVSTNEKLRGERLNIAEPVTPTIALWMEQIATVAGADVDLIRVSDSLLPPDLILTKGHPQHVLADGSAAERRLRWRPEPAARRIAESVQWHLAHQTYQPWSDADLEADERALRSTG